MLLCACSHYCAAELEQAVGSRQNMQSLVPDMVALFCGAIALLKASPGKLLLVDGGCAIVGLRFEVKCALVAQVGCSEVTWPSPSCPPLPCLSCRVWPRNAVGHLHPQHG